MQKKLNILVANDDGIHAKGIAELVSVLKEISNIYVCAPSQERSGVGHGITVFEPLVLKEEEFGGAVKAYSCSGTPADCVKLGIRTYRAQGVEIDLVFSGINHGANLGTDTLYSGTVSAAMEGLMCGKPAVAVSSCANAPQHFESCYAIVRKVALEAAKCPDRRWVLNINIPDLPLDQIKGVKATRLGPREYDDSFTPTSNENGTIVFTYAGKPVVYEDLDPTLDVAAFQENYITITPLGSDLTLEEAVQNLSAWDFVDRDEDGLKTIRKKPDIKEAKTSNS